MCEMVVFLFWQGHLCNSRDDTIYDLLLFGKDVKMLLQLATAISLDIMSV